MNWLNSAVEAAMARKPEGEIMVESGVSPSGKYHLGTLREVLTAEAIARELKHRGRAARHVHFVDDLDGLRKIPAGVPAEFEKYLGQPLADVPAPEGEGSWADYYLSDLEKAASTLNLNMEIIRSHRKYREGFFIPAIEKTLENISQIRQVMEKVAGRKLDPNYSPIQVNEEGYLKSRKFLSLDKQARRLHYVDLQGVDQTISYSEGQVKLDWRVDWPARWWLLKVDVEPFGRDHATKGGSYETGAAIVENVFGTKPPLPLPYEFINRAGQTKKMSKSAGETVSLAHLLEILPAEVVWYFVLRMPAGKQLYFDEGEGVMKLIDDFAQLLAKSDKSDSEQQLIRLITGGQPVQTISNIPFSHLIASYQAALKDPAKTLEILSRTEYKDVATQQIEVIKSELIFIDRWLKEWAPDDLKFELLEKADPADFSDSEKAYLSALADKLAGQPADADGETLHKIIYEFKDSDNITPQQLFGPLYRALIGKNSGPRAGWFLAMLPRDWLLKRLRLEV